MHLAALSNDCSCYSLVCFGFSHWSMAQMRCDCIIFVRIDYNSLFCENTEMHPTIINVFLKQDFVWLRPDYRILLLVPCFCSGAYLNHILRCYILLPCSKKKEFHHNSFCHLMFVLKDAMECQIFDNIAISDIDIKWWCYAFQVELLF